MKHLLASPHFWLKSRILLPILLFMVVVLQAPAAHAIISAGTSDGPGTGIQAGQLLTGGKDHRAQDAAWLQLKLAHKIHRNGATLVQASPSPSYPSQSVLPLSPANSVSEPPTGANSSSYADSAGHIFTDNYMWNLCGPGATTVTLGYWTNISKGSTALPYSDPKTTTYWADSDPHYSGHTGTLYFSYVMYIATQTDPPAYTSPGEMTYQSYPNAYAAFADVRDALNWEASNHNYSTYFNYFYAVVGIGSLSFSSFLQDVEEDIYDHVPLIVSTQDGGYLPDWPTTSHTSHYVAIIGYNNSTNTFTYAETCGNEACQTTGTGIYTVNQQTLYNGMVNDNGNGGIIW